MPPPMTEAVTRQQSQASAIGQALVLGGAALIASTVWLLPGTNSDRVAACVIAATMSVLAIAWRAAIPTSQHPRTLVGYPIILFIGLAALGCLHSGFATSYTSLFTLAFIYLGLWGPRRSTIPLVLLAIPCWLLNNGVLINAPMRSIEVRLPMAVIIWVTIGQLLSQHSQATRRTAASLRREASRDPLTGLRNRRVLDLLLADADHGDALVLIDIDHFKDVNDARGHVEGDRVLVEFARVLTRSLRSQDVAIRFGGDEFCVYLPGTAIDRAEAAVERIRGLWAEIDGTTFSAGIATVRVGRDGADAFGEADRFLYQAKSVGRNQTARRIPTVATVA